MAKLPSPPTRADSRWGGVDESLRLTCPESRAPTAVSGETLRLSVLPSRAVKCFRPSVECSSFCSSNIANRKYKTSIKIKKDQLGREMSLPIMHAVTNSSAACLQSSGLSAMSSVMPIPLWIRLLKTIIKRSVTGNPQSMSSLRMQQKEQKNNSAVSPVSTYSGGGRMSATRSLPCTISR